MRKLGFSPFPLAVVTLVLASALPAQIKAGVYEDKKNGFKIRVPDKWSQVPISIDEKWIVARFLCPRTYETKSRDFTDYGEHKPVLTVIVFSNEARKAKPVEVERKGGTTYLKDRFEPYRDYKDYLKRNLSEGFYFDAETPGKVNGVDVTKYSVKIEKNAETKRRLYTWVFKASDGDYAAEFEVLEDHAKAFEGTFNNCLASFRFVPKVLDASANDPRLEAPMWTRDRDAWRKLPAKERMAKRKEIEAARQAAMQKSLPPGWKAERTKNYLVLTHADAKFTARVVEAIQACRNWLDETFGELSDEYVMQGVVRICANYDEARAYLKTSSDWGSYSPEDREVVFYQDKGDGNAGLGFGLLFAGLLDQYLDDKDSLLLSYMPSWLHGGLYQYIGTAKIRGGKLVFEPSDWEREMMRDAVRKGQIASMQQILGAQNESLKQEKVREFYYQAAQMVRFFFGAGGSVPRFESFVLRYAQAVIPAAQAVIAADEKRDSREANTEEEEERRAKERAQYWPKRRAAVLGRIHDEVLKLATSEWDTANAVWLAYVKGNN